MNKRIERELHRTKVVVRHLPCQLTEEKLCEQLTPLPPSDYMYFVQGDASYNQFGYSRVYINFTNEDDIVPFKERWDGYLFEDDAGSKTHAVVEFAPFQRIPRKNKRKPDSKCGTIETDPEFLAFSEAYEKDVEPLPSIDKTTYMLEEPKAASKETTALIEYLKDRKEQRARARAAKEAKRREKKAKEKSRKEKVEPVKTSSSASMKVASITRQSGRGEGGGERGGGPKPVSSAAQPLEGKGLPVKASSSTSSGLDVASSRQSSQARDYGDEASVRIIARPGGGGGGGRRSGQVAEKGRQKYGGERDVLDAGTVKKMDPSPGAASGKDDRGGSQPQRGGGERERRGGGRGRGEKKPDRSLYNPRSKRDGEGEESTSGSYRGRGSGRPYYGRGRGRGGRGGGQRYNQDKPQN